LTQEEKQIATDIAMMWEQSKFPRARVQIEVNEETDDEGRPIYGVIAEATGRLPRLGNDSPGESNLGLGSTPPDDAECGDRRGHSDT
jgi:hypothetical protein